MLTAFGITSAATMVLAYAFEDKSTVWVAIFAAACMTTAAYGIATEAWLFAALETIWAGIALRRFTIKRKRT